MTLGMKQRGSRFILCSFFLLLVFQNCSQQNQNDSNSQSSPSVSSDQTQNMQTLTEKSSNSTLQGYKLLMGGFTQLYSPYLMNNSTMFLGGWATNEDHQAKDDRLYRSTLRNGVWQYPEPIQWTNPGFIPGYVKDFHTNDPTVVHRPDVNWHYMYYTLLSNEFVTFADITAHNWVGFASSSDGGNTWTHHGVVIGQNNGYDQFGAWSPSAVRVNNEIWVYYHNSKAQVLRTRMKLNGWEKIETTPITTMQGGGIALLNVDIQYAYGKYWLTGGSDLTHINLMLSDDGIRFYPYDGQRGLLIDGVSNGVITPNVQVTSASSINVMFGFCQNTANSADGVGQCSSIHEWSLQLNPVAPPAPIVLPTPAPKPPSPPPLPPPPPPTNVSEIRGYIDGLQMINGKVHVAGWACASGRAESIRVQMYAGGEDKKGQLIGSYTANSNNEAAVNTVCNDTSKTPHRFLIPLEGTTRSKYANQGIYIHGISTTGGVNKLLNKSGVYMIPAPTPLSAIKGYIDGISKSVSGAKFISGWACSSGRADSIQIHLYAGGAAGAGRIVGGYVANLKNEPAVNSACGDTTQTPHRFQIPIDANMIKAHGNKTIFIHGISPVGNANSLLGQSGKFVIPAQ